MQLNHIPAFFKSVKHFLAIALFVCSISISAKSFSNVHHNLPVINTDSVTKKSSFENFYKYMAHTIRYPREARENGITGIVIIDFKLNDDKKIGKVIVETKLGNGLEDEILRVFQLFVDEKKDINPGVFYKLPVIFKLDGLPDPAPLDPEFKKQPNVLNGLVITGYQTIH